MFELKWMGKVRHDHVPHQPRNIFISSKYGYHVSKVMID